MAKYTSLVTVTDPALVIAEEHLVSADVYVDSELIKRGVTPSDLTLPIPLLTDMAAAYAKSLAALEGAIGDNSPLIDKHDRFKKLAKDLAEAITVESVGLTRPTGTSYGTVTLGRG